MNPILFGTRERQLFGIFTPAHGRRKRQGAVICQPWGQEYERAHRACRLLGERLSANGYDVLRFDYFGTGDSGGGGAAVTMEGCTQDTERAVEEICALAGVRRAMLVGLRLGAAIAHRAAIQDRSVNRLVLWDPVSDGADYLAELAGVNGGARAEAHLAGYPMTAVFETELRALDQQVFAQEGVRDVLLITSEDRPNHALLLEALRRTHSTVEAVTLPGPRSWVPEGDLGAGAVPVDILEHIASWERPAGNA